MDDKKISSIWFRKIYVFSRVIKEGLAMIYTDELQKIADLTVSLVKLRQDYCNHLVIENIAPEIFGKLLAEYEMHKQGKMRLYNDS